MARQADTHLLTKRFKTLLSIGLAGGELQLLRRDLLAQALRFVDCAEAAPPQHPSQPQVAGVNFKLRVEMMISLNI